MKIGIWIMIGRHRAPFDHTENQQKRGGRSDTVIMTSPPRLFHSLRAFILIVLFHKQVFRQSDYLIR